MIGEKSIIPIGGINFLKKPRYGSHNLANNRPNEDSWAAGTQDMRMYTISMNEYIENAIDIIDIKEYI